MKEERELSVISKALAELDINKIHEDKEWVEISQISAKQFNKLMKKKDPVFIIKAEISPDKEVFSKVDIEIQPLLEEFRDVFPTDLPDGLPRRDVQHHIDLKPGAKPFSRSPYRLSSREQEVLKE